jgi:Mitochondrial K+-H+ exchange-related
MDVFLIPLGADRHELYCEAPQAEAGPEEADRPRGLIAGLRQRFTERLAAAERDRARRVNGDPPDVPDTWWERVQARTLAWIADAIAEQRLLWHLRHQDTAHLHFPADMPAERALAVARASLARDHDRHRFWLIVDSLLMVLSAALVLVPGPNLIGYYFAFRVVGHFLAWRGARQGLDRVQWVLAPSQPLVDLRQALGLAPLQREQQVVDIASRLQLAQLPTFVGRVAWPGA